ncbi:hypothetical protein RESH_01694 [Rhodopirellula europaea SH398]|uniref:Uncharacterized protein n=1 Tax=Rhodopirellula europaea SH398 TaxID=1263868 RepID=M5S871_9BACT|nr:hypothetical protein RESH_01694 [Rhodopirellula europaea SH398]
MLRKHILSGKWLHSQIDLISDLVWIDDSLFQPARVQLISKREAVSP